MFPYFGPREVKSEDIKSKNISTLCFMLRNPVISRNLLAFGLFRHGHSCSCSVHEILEFNLLSYQKMSQKTKGKLLVMTECVRLNPIL